MDIPIVADGVSIIIKKKQTKKRNRMTNHIDPDETARYEPPHLVLHCFQRYINFFLLKYRIQPNHCTVRLVFFKVFGEKTNKNT